MNIVAKMVWEKWRGGSIIAINSDSDNGREDTKEIEYVYACCFQINKPSKRLIEKCGFRFEGEGSFYSESLNKNFKSFEYVYSKNDWKLLKELL